jgi:outer membrane receptor protein involved in Fe transport
MDSMGFFRERLFDELQNRAFRVSTLYNRKLSHHLTLRTGITFSHLYYDYLSRESFTNPVPTIVLNSAGSTNLYQAYVQSKYAFSNRLVLRAGLHYAHFGLSRDNSFEPRLGISYSLPGNQKISLGYGLHSKNENLPVYFVEQTLEDGSIYKPNLSLQMTRSMHLILGYEKMFGSDLQFKTEAYYQHISNLAVPANPQKYWAPIFGGVNPGDTLANIGEGRNYGLELTLQKYFTREYYFLFTSSLFDSEYKPADGQWYDTKFNLGFINNLVGGKEIMWGEHRMVGLNLRVIWSGGRRYLTVDLPESMEQGHTVFINSEVFSKQGPDYFRIDLGLKLHFFREKAEHVLSLDIQNLTNRINVLAEEYNSETRSIWEYPMTGFLPILNYRLEF